MLYIINRVCKSGKTNTADTLYTVFQGPVFTKGFSQGLGLKLRLLSSFCPKTGKTFVLGLVIFSKNLLPVLGFAKGSTLILVVSGVKFL